MAAVQAPFGTPRPDMRYELDDGTHKEFRYTDFRGTDESQWVLPFRCKVCPDGIGEAAENTGRGRCP